MSLEKGMGGMREGWREAGRLGVLGRYEWEGEEPGEGEF